jgi:DNA-binding response OmpR family regulator
MDTTPKTILLIEDEPLLGNLLKQRLEKENLQVALERDGQAALDYLATNKPDLILLDIILPKLSGFELMEKIRSNPNLQQSPIVIISNLGQESDVEKGKALGAIGYFVKAQLSIEDLVSRVKGFLTK